MYGRSNGGIASMTGGFWAPIVIPIVAALALFSWIAAVYYADAHPGWRNQPRRPVQHITGIRDPIEPVEEREREPAMTTPGAEAPPSAPSAPSPAGQAGATPPRPRTPSESEQLERQARERRLRRDERVGRGIDRGRSLAQFGAEMVPGGHGRLGGLIDHGEELQPLLAVTSGSAWALSSVIVSSSVDAGTRAGLTPWRGARCAISGGSSLMNSAVTRNMSRWLRHGTVSSAASASPRGASTRGSARLGAGWRGTASIRGIARPRRARSTGP
jgi:hypothetical protein